MESRLAASGVKAHCLNATRTALRFSACLTGGEKPRTGIHAPIPASGVMTACPSAAPLAHQAASQSRPVRDVTQEYAADWTIVQLREPAQKIADRIKVLMCVERTAERATY